MYKLEVGGRLQTFRKAKKLSGEALGNLLGLKRSGIAHIEAGRANLMVPHLRTLMEAFPDLNVYWLVNNQGEMYINIPMQDNSDHSDKIDETCWKLLELERIKSKTYLDIINAHNIKID